MAGWQGGSGDLTEVCAKKITANIIHKSQAMQSNSIYYVPAATHEAEQ